MNLKEAIEKTYYLKATDSSSGGNDYEDAVYNAAKRWQRLMDGLPASWREADNYDMEGQSLALIGIHQAILIAMDDV